MKYGIHKLAKYGIYYGIYYGISLPLLFKCVFSCLSYGSSERISSQLHAVNAFVPQFPFPWPALPLFYFNDLVGDIVRNTVIFADDINHSCKCARVDIKQQFLTVKTLWR